MLGTVSCLFGKGNSKLREVKAYEKRNLSTGELINSRTSDLKWAHPHPSWCSRCAYQDRENYSFSHAEVRVVSRRSTSSHFVFSHLVQFKNHLSHQFRALALSRLEWAVECGLNFVWFSIVSLGCCHFEMTAYVDYSSLALLLVDELDLWKS